MPTQSGKAELLSRSSEPAVDSRTPAEDRPPITAQLRPTRTVRAPLTALGELPQGCSAGTEDIHVSVVTPAVANPGPGSATVEDRVETPQ